MNNTYIRAARAALAGILLASGVAALSAAQAAEPIQLRAELDRGVLPSAPAAKETTVVKISIDGLRIERPEARPPINLALVIDRSGSMSGEKIAHARAAALETVRRLSSKDIVSIVAFDSEVQTLLPARHPKDLREIEKIIERIQSDGGTALYGGVLKGAEQVRKNLKNSGYTHRILLLSDGQANVGPHTPQELGELGGKLVNERISVSTIGLGLGYDEDLMTSLALKSDGNTYFARSAADLSEIFGTELGDVLNVVARDVKISARFPEDVRLVRCLGRECVIKSQRMELTINQIYGGQEKFVLVEVEVPSAKDKESREIAVVDITFEDALAQKKSAQKTVASARFSTDQAAVIKSANHKVQTDYAEAIIAAANDEAIALADAQKHKEAAAHLRKAADSVRQMGEKYDNAPIVNIGQSNAALSDQIAQEGINTEQRKQFKTMNAQKASQQGSSRGK